MTLELSKLKLKPDSAVLVAVGQMHNMRKFKRMILFGLRSLSELCVPPRANYKENSLSALEAGVLGPITDLLEDHLTDDDYIVSACKVLWGITEGLKQECSAKLNERFSDSKAIHTVMSIIKVSLNEPLYDLPFKAMQNICELQMYYNETELVDGFFLKLRESILLHDSSLLKELMKTLCLLCKNNKTAAIIVAEGDGVSEMLKVCLQLSPSSTENLTICDYCLKAVCYVALTKKCPLGVINLLIELMELYTSKKNIIDRGIEAISALMGPERLNSCFQALSSKSENSEEKKNALSMLRCMSYIKTYAEAIVSSGSVPLLCEALRKSATDISQGYTDPLFINAFIGTCDMLGAIASIPKHLMYAVEEAGGLNAVMYALESVIEIPSAIACCCTALIPMVASQLKFAKIIINTNAPSLISKALLRFHDHIGLLQAGMGFIISFLSHSSLFSDNTKFNVMPLITELMQYHLDDVLFQKRCLLGLEECLLCPQYHLATLVDLNTLGTISRFINTSSLHGNDQSTAEIISRVLSRLSQKFLDTDSFNSTDIVELTVKLMLDYAENITIQRYCQSALKIFAKKEDVTKALSNLEKALLNAKSNVKDAFKALAAVGGFSQILRLQECFQNGNAADIIVRSINTWVSEEPFPEQQLIIRSGLQSIQHLTMKGLIDRFIIELLKGCSSLSMQKIIKSQENSCNTVLDILKSVSCLLKSRNGNCCIEHTDNFIAISTELKHIMESYPSQRLIHISSISLLNQMSPYPNATTIYDDLGLFQYLFRYMQRVTIYEDIQMIGFQFITISLKHNPTLGIRLRAYGGIDIIRAANRTHGKSKEMQLYLSSLVAILIPPEQIENELRDYIKLIRKESFENNPTNCIHSLRSMSQIIGSHAGVQIALRIGIVDSCLCIIKSIFESNDASLTYNIIVEVLYYILVIINSISDTRPGCHALYKCNALHECFQIIQLLMPYPESIDKEKCLELCNRIITNLISYSPTQATQIFENNNGMKDLLPLLTLSSENPDLFDSICSCLTNATKLVTSRNDQDDDIFVNYILEGIEDSHNRPKQIRCLEAINELVLLSHQRVSTILVSHKCTTSLLTIMNNFSDDPDIVSLTQQCFHSMSTQSQMIDNWRKDSLQDGGLSGPILIFKKLLRDYRDNAAITSSTIQLLTVLANDQDKELLKTSGIIDDLYDISKSLASDHIIMGHIGKLAKLAGTDNTMEGLMHQIINCVSFNPEDEWVKDIDSTYMELNSYLLNKPHPVPPIALVGQTLEALTLVFQKKSSSIVLSETILLTARNLLTCIPLDMKDDLNPDIIKIKSHVSKLSLKIIDIMYQCHTLTGPMEYNQLLRDGFGILTKSLQMNGAHDIVFQNNNNYQSVDTLVLSLLQTQHINDPNCVSELLYFINEFNQGNTLDVCNHGKTHPYQDTTRSLEQYLQREGNKHILLSDITHIMKYHRHHNIILNQSINLLKQSVSKKPLSFEDYSCFFKEMLDTNDSAELITIMLILQHELYIMVPTLNGDQHTFNMLLHQTLSVLQSTQHHGTKEHLIESFICLLNDCLEPERFHLIQESQCIQKLPLIIEESKRHSKLFQRVIESCSLLASTNLQCRSQLTNALIPSVLEDVLTYHFEEEQSLINVSKFLQVLCSDPINKKAIKNIPEFSNFISDISIKDATITKDTLVGNELKETLQQLMHTIDQETADEDTLEKIYNNLMVHKASGHHLIIDKLPELNERITFIFETTEEYSKEELIYSDDHFISKEFKYGCQSIQLFHEYAENAHFCYHKNEHHFLLYAIKNQTNEFIRQWAILVLIDAVKSSSLLCTACCDLSDSALIITNTISSARLMSCSKDQRESILIPRLQLVQQFSSNRTYFQHTHCLNQLIELWEDWNNGLYSDHLAIHIFRSIRLMLHDSFIPLLLKYDVPKRLLDIIKKKKTAIDILPDVLFLLGSLGVVPELKTIIGDLKGIEVCVDLWKRCRANKKDDTHRSQINVMLSLANLLMGHQTNISRFTMVRGQDLNLLTLEQSLLNNEPSYDLINVSAILICNTCFKLDEQKKIYGERKGPLILMQAIKQYDGRDDPMMIRCLNSLFKAIGNLALYHGNITEFLNNGIDDALIHFYNLSKSLPDQLIEVSLRMTANLVMENTEIAMIRFGPLLQPLLDMVQQENRVSISMISLCFETLGCLCRLPQNTLKFVELKGIQIMLHILNRQNNEELHITGIFLLAILTTDKNSIDILVDSNVMIFFLNILQLQIRKIADYAQTMNKRQDKENDNEDDEDDINDLEYTIKVELIVSSLRCLRKMFLNKNAGTSFIILNGVSCLIHLCEYTQQSAIVQSECYRVILHLIHLFLPTINVPKTSTGTLTHSAPNSPSEDWEGDVMDEGVLPVVALLERPVGPRAWESFNITHQQLSRLILSIMSMLHKEKRQKRLIIYGLGILAYVACEKVEKVVETFYKGKIDLLCESVLIHFPNMTTFLVLCCYIINNVAFSSEPHKYSIIRKNKNLRCILQNAVAKLQKNDKTTKHLVSATVHLLQEKSLDTQRFSIVQQWDFPLDITGWNRDPYPNGVQDLSMDMKEDIRLGGKLKIILQNGTREIFHWKSSYDLLTLTWGINDTKLYQHKAHISQLKTLAKGCASPQFECIRHKYRNTLNKFSSRCCCILGILPSTELPEGANLWIVCVSVKARDRFVDLLLEWREAATYGF